MQQKIIIFLLILVPLLFFLLVYYRKKAKKFSFENKSLASRYGKLTEQFLPFLEAYPYNPQNFRFLGTPIDGLQFEDDQIIFIEFKVASSNLNEKQKRIKQLVQNKSVKFEEYKIR